MTSDPRTILVTGATDGLGRDLASRLAGEGHHVLLHGRSTEKLDAAAASIHARHPQATIDMVRADLANLAEVRAMAAEVHERFGALDVLVANAAIGPGAPGGASELSTDGIELRLAVNFLAVRELVLELLTTLGASRRRPARVVLVASAGQQPVDFDDPQLERAYRGGDAYCRSKLALVAFGLDLAAQLDPREVTVNSLHPGTHMPTTMVLEADMTPRDTLESGVDAVHALAVDPRWATETGAYVERGAATTAHPWAHDTANQLRLRELAEQLALPHATR